MKLIADPGVTFRGGNEKVGSTRNFLHKYFQKFYQATFQKKKMQCFW